LPVVGSDYPVELGISFTSDVNGFVTGIRFYKNTANIGTHVGSLWDAARNLLASATFTSESASGWQRVSFSHPVSVTATTFYVAPNGVYAYGSGSTFPMSTNSANYWVDVVFSPNSQ
jgi:Domain of unknown function (DUF4082)